MLESEREMCGTSLSVLGPLRLSFINCCGGHTKFAIVWHVFLSTSV